MPGKQMFLKRSSLDAFNNRGFSQKSAESRPSKVNAMPSFDVNAMISSIFFKQRFKLPTFSRSSAVSQIEGRQGRESAV